MFDSAPQAVVRWALTALVLTLVFLNLRAVAVDPADWDFMPTGRHTQRYMAVLWFSFLIVLLTVFLTGRRSVIRLALIMGLSWFLARTSTVVDSIVLQSVGTFICAVAALALGTTAGLLVSLLFFLKLIVYAAANLGQWHVEQMWTVSEALAYLQILVMIAASSDGGSVVVDWFFRRLPGHRLVRHLRAFGYHADRDNPTD